MYKIRVLFEAIGNNGRYVYVFFEYIECVSNGAATKGKNVDSYDRSENTDII